MHARDMVGVRFCRASMVGRDQQLVVRDESRRPVHDVGVANEQPGSREVRLQLRAHALVEPSACDGNTEQEESEQDGQLIRVAEPSQVGRQLGRAGEELIPGCEPLLDSVRLVAGDA
jgi:hypothetical protein